MRRNKYRTILFLSILVFLITAFILSNSIVDYEQSHNSSESITNIIVGTDGAKNNYVETLIRKTAHIIEFCFLGIFLTVCVTYIRIRLNLKLKGYMFFYLLSVAVTDEYVQSFSDRTSSVGDIILDFCGALVGVFIGWLFIKFCVLIKQQYNKKSKEMD